MVKYKFQQILDRQLDSFSKVSGADIMISREAAKSLTEANLIAKKMKKVLLVETFMRENLLIFSTDSPRVSYKIRVFSFIGQSITM